MLERGREREMVGLEQAPEYGSYLDTREPVTGREHPDSLTEHHVGDKERGVVGDSLLDERCRLRGLSFVVTTRKRTSTFVSSAIMRRPRPCGWSRSSPRR